MGRIMVVDDEPDMRLAVRLILERHGHTVEEAASGDEALPLVQADAPDLLLMDVRMPGQDGLQTLGKIRESNPALPVIIMTGYGNPETEREAFRKGASHYLLKPFRNEELLEAVSAAGLTERKARPAARESPILGKSRIPHSSLVQHFIPFFQRLGYVLRQARAIFLDRWLNPPILFERDPGLEERISLRLSLILDPLKVIFHGLFDPEFEYPLEDPEQEPPQAWATESEPPIVRASPEPRIPPPDYPRAFVETAPAALEPGAHQAHQDLSEQIQSIAQSLQAEMGRLSEQMHQRQDSPPVMAAPSPAAQGSRESPQEEFHRLLIELQTTWDQGLSAVGKELAADQDVIQGWSKTLPALRQAVDHSQAA